MFNIKYNTHFTEVGIDRYNMTQPVFGKDHSGLNRLRDNRNKNRQMNE